MKNIYYLILLTLFSINCANQLPPGGGDIDLTPPIIIRTFPENGTTNYDKNYVEITFSEYVEKRSVREALFISPNIEGEIIFNWSGTSCRITFPEKFKEDITYVVTFGTDIVDYNNRNRMAGAVSIYFSTGDKIDNGFIEGKIYSENSDGIMIFAYRTEIKDVDPSEIKPDYISQSGSDGNFLLSGLAKGTYRIFAVKDEFRDFLFQAEQDLIGIPFSDITLTEIDTAYFGLNFFMSKIDTVAPRISSVIMTDKHHIIVGLTEAFDNSILLNINNFIIIDSTSNIKFNPVYLYKGEATRENEFVIVINNELSKENDIFLLAENLIDKNGNRTVIDYSRITVSDKSDTTKPSLVKSNPFSGSDRVDFLSPQFEFYFDDAINIEELSKTIIIKDTLNNKYDFDLIKIDDASFKIKIIKELTRNNFYTIQMDLNKAEDIAGNKYDSIYVYKFKTITGLEFTGVSGRVENILIEENPILILKRTDSNKEEYYQKLSNNKFNFERLSAGKFTLMAFYDKDNDGKYSYGWPFPFKPSEKFAFYHDEIQLRPRWSLTDLLFNFLR